MNIKTMYNLNSYPIIGIVGRIVEGKGHIDFLNAAKIILEHKPNVKFMVVGAGDNKLEMSLRRYSSLIGLNKNVIFTGWKNNVMEFINIFDILVQASSTYPEGFGRTCIEAMALEKPVVATDIPGPSEIVVDGKTGFLVPPANPEKLAEAIIQILNNKELAAGFGKAGRLRAEEFFEATKIAKKIEALYEEVLPKTS